MTANADVVIVGGGVFGLTTAWYLANQGTSVVLLDKGEIGKQASWAGAGIIPPAVFSGPQTGLDQLRAHSYQLYPELSQSLFMETGINNGYVQCGGIELPVSGSDKNDIPSEEWAGRGTPFQPLNRYELNNRMPGLSANFNEGVLISGMAQVRNPWHLRALMAGCLSRAVKLIPNFPFESFQIRGHRVIGINQSEDAIHADKFLITAGAWSDILLNQFEITLSIQPVRGQIALFNPGKPGIRPILLQGNRYLVTRTDGRVLAGSTEENVGFVPFPTEEGIASLVSFAKQLLPELASTPLENAWAGLRPGSPDGLPFIGKVPGMDNLYVASGHFRAGLQLSPGTGSALANVMIGKPSIVPLDDFRLDRPPIPTERAKR